MYDDQNKTWQGTFKMIFNTGRNCYIERGSKVAKQPTHWVRKMHPEEERGIPPQSSPSNNDVGTNPEVIASGG